MTRQQYIDAVAAFARDYINDPNERTHERNELLVSAASVVLGRQLGGCTTCYTEVALLIYNQSKMEQSNYIMRHGALLEVFSRADLVMTVHNTTDDLAELHLGLKPHEIVYFSEFPKDETGEFVDVTAERLAELKAKFDVEIEYPTEVKAIVSIAPTKPIEIIAPVAPVAPVEPVESIATITPVVDEPQSLTDLIEMGGAEINPEPEQESKIELFGDGGKKVKKVNK